MSIQDHETTPYSLLFYWMAPMYSSNLEYLPSISELRMPETTVNKTWTTKTNYKFTFLKPYTTYNLTVYVREQNKPNVIYPPGYFILATTTEGGIYNYIF